MGLKAGSMQFTLLCVKYRLLHAYITCSPFSLLSLGLLLYQSEHPIRELEFPQVDLLFCSLKTIAISKYHQSQTQPMRSIKPVIKFITL
jgi:hypothetical protein